MREDSFNTNEEIELSSEEIEKKTESIQRRKQWLETFRGVKLSNQFNELSLGQQEKELISIYKRVNLKSQNDWRYEEAHKKVKEMMKLKRRMNNA